MPIIHVKSLPFDPPLEMSSILEGITQDLAEETEITLEHITATWAFFPPGHYAVAGKSAVTQPRKTHPVIVDVLVPDYNQADTVKQILNCIADSLAKRTGILRENIFINLNRARSGQVFDVGEMVEW